MAHGPVNRSYNLSINNKPALTYRVKESDYIAIKSEPDTLVKVLVAGNRTHYTAIVVCGMSKEDVITNIEKEGYKLSKGRSYVKFINQEVEYDE